MMVVSKLFNDPVYRYIASNGMRMIKGCWYGFDGGSHSLPKCATWRWRKAVKIYMPWKLAVQSKFKSGTS
jgi:hypothetical protein